MNKVQLIKKVHFKDLKNGDLVSSILPALLENFISVQLIQKSIDSSPVFMVNNLSDNVISFTTVFNYSASFEKNKNFKIVCISSLFEYYYLVKITDDGTGISNEIKGERPNKNDQPNSNEGETMISIVINA